MDAIKRAKEVEKFLSYLKKANIVLTEEEKANVEINEYEPCDYDDVGLGLIVYVNTERVCAKEMVLYPGQSCPEHWHVPSYRKEGKEETFRCRYGTVYLYVDGEGKKEDIVAKLPGTKVTVFHEIILHPGEQYTLYPGTKHWFQGGPEGCIVSEFSTKSTDETDEMTDERLIRKKKAEEK